MRYRATYRSGVIVRQRSDGDRIMTNTATLDVLAMCAAFAMVTAMIVGAW